MYILDTHKAFKATLGFISVMTENNENKNKLFNYPKLYQYPKGFRKNLGNFESSHPEIIFQHGIDTTIDYTQVLKTIYGSQHMQDKDLYNMNEAFMLLQKHKALINDNQIPNSLPDIVISELKKLGPTKDIHFGNDSESGIEEYLILPKNLKDFNPGKVLMCDVGGDAEADANDRYAFF